MDQIVDDALLLREPRAAERWSGERRGTGVETDGELHALGAADYGRAAQIAKLAEHDVVFFEGDPARFVYQVVEGAVMLYKLLPDGRRQVVELLGPGDVFGLACGEAHDCAAETLTAGRVRVFERRLCERSVAFQCLLSRHMQEQLQAMRDHTVLLGRKSAMERVASFLMRLALGRNRAEEDAIPQTNPVISLAMTRQEIADYLGLTIETVSRSFSELRRRGHIAFERQDRVRINDLAAMSGLTGAQ